MKEKRKRSNWLEFFYCVAGRTTIEHSATEDYKL